MSKTAQMPEYKKKNLSNFKIGEIMLCRHDWRISFKCNLCLTEIVNLKSFLTHSLEHLYDINEEAIDILLNSTNSEFTPTSDIELNDRSADSIDQDFLCDLDEQQLLNSDDSNDEKVNMQEYLQDEEAVSTLPKKEDEETIEVYKSNLGETVLTDLVEEEFLAEDGSGFEKEFLDIRTDNTIATKRKRRRKLTTSTEKKQNSNEFYCTTCQKSYVSKEGLNNHIKRHTAEHACDLCSAVFNDYGNLRVHRFRHLGIQPHSCKICEKRFTTTTEVKLHMRTHTGEKPYVCEECGLSFVTSSGYHIHKRRTHEKLRPLKCDSCEKAFLTNIELDDHVRLHKNDKPLKCPECGEGFKTNRTLLRHKKKHLKLISYKCNYCSKEYNQSIGLHWHIKREHSAKQE